MNLKIHNSKKWENTTKNQIAGAIAQLVDSNDISKELGELIILKDIESTSVNTKASSNNAKRGYIKS